MNISIGNTAQDRQNEAVIAWIEGTMAKYERNEFLNKEQAEAETRLDYTAIAPEVYICCACEKRPVSTKVSGYEMCDDCAIPAIIAEMRETESQGMMEIYLADLMALGWVAR